MTFLKPSTFEVLNNFDTYSIMQVPSPYILPFDYAPVRFKFHTVFHSLLVWSLTTRTMNMGCFLCLFIKESSINVTRASAVPLYKSYLTASSQQRASWSCHAWASAVLALASPCELEKLCRLPLLSYLFLYSGQRLGSMSYWNCFLHMQAGI